MIIIWLALSFLVAWMGSERKVGFWGALILSLLLSPLVGFIITILSKTLEQERREMRMLEETRAQTDALRAMSSPGQSVAQELRHLKELLDAGAISQQQYDAAVAKVTGAA